MPPSWSQQRVGAGEPPAAHVAGPLALAVEEAVLAAVARAVLGHQRDVLVLAKVLLPVRRVAFVDSDSVLSYVLISGSMFNKRHST